MGADSQSLALLLNERRKANVGVLYYEYCKFGRDKIERECTSALFSVTLHLYFTHG